MTNNSVLKAVWSIVAAFGTYFCMYGFRKPFTSASYSGTDFYGFDYKTILIAGQVIGYTLSKFIGIKFISEMQYQGRAFGILILVVISHLALLGFALVPAPWNCFMLFLNGIPLGMVFGLVMGFLEGRKLTELLLGFLCASFILADGVSKSVGSYILEKGVSEAWMPFFAGLIFVLPFLLFTFMLSTIPQPLEADILARSKRSPMSFEDRKYFFSKYMTGLVLIIVAYLLVTILRSVRSDYAPEIWKGLGFDGKPEKFTTSELWVTLGVVISSGLFVFFNDNKKAFYFGLFLCLFGLSLAFLAVVFLELKLISGFWFMVFIGLGLYLPYVVVHTTLFERLLSMTKEKGNCGYLMYLADAFGYLGYVGIIILNFFISREISFLKLFEILVVGVCLISLILLVCTWIYFLRNAIVNPDSIDNPL